MTDLAELPVLFAAMTLLSDSIAQTVIRRLWANPHWRQHHRHSGPDHPEHGRLVIITNHRLMNRRCIGQEQSLILCSFCRQQ